MYGHIETPRQIMNHLAILRDIQKDTGGFTEFVPLGFIHERNMLYNFMGSRPGPSMAEDLRMIAVSRLFLRPWIANIQISWVKMGPKLGQMALCAGANDFGGTLMDNRVPFVRLGFHKISTAHMSFAGLVPGPKEASRPP